MAKIEYKVLAGIDYPPNKRAEAGDYVSDLPKDSIPWLLESGVIERVGNVKKISESEKSVDESTQSVGAVAKEVDDEL